MAAGRGYSRKLTVPAEALKRWQGYFDRMASDAAADPRCLKDVRRLRRTLDFAALARWGELSKAYPDYFSDYMVFRKRLGVLPKFCVAMVEDWETMIKVAGHEKPLPAQFDGIDKSFNSAVDPVAETRLAENAHGRRRGLRLRGGGEPAGQAFHVRVLSE